MSGYEDVGSSGGTTLTLAGNAGNARSRMDSVVSRDHAWGWRTSAGWTRTTSRDVGRAANHSTSATNHSRAEPKHRSRSCTAVSHVTLVKATLKPGSGS